MNLALRLNAAWRVLRGEPFILGPGIAEPRIAPGTPQGEYLAAAVAAAEAEFAWHQRDDIERRAMSAPRKSDACALWEELRKHPTSIELSVATVDTRDAFAAAKKALAC